jgi:hypothetical protein
MKKSKECPKKRNLMKTKVSICILYCNAFLLKGHIESLYNEGKGIQITATLIGLLSQPKAGKKCCLNAKPPTTTKVIYIYEKMPFINAVYIIVGQSLG